MIIPSRSIITVREFEPQDLKATVSIHRATLGYTLNSCLGESHLAAMYSNMAQQRGAYVGVALQGDQRVGIVSGTVDLDQARAQLLRSFAVSHWLFILSRMLLHPVLLREWWNGNVIGRPVYDGGIEVRAILTTIAVDPACQGQGIGRRLVEALETYFAQHAVPIYRLDTLVENQQARDFYRRIGFTEVATRADSVVLIKRITAAGRNSGQ